MLVLCRERYAGGFRDVRDEAMMADGTTTTCKVSVSAILLPTAVKVDKLQRGLEK